MTKTALNLSGYKFGRLTAIALVSGRRWICRCECGKTKRIATGHLRSGHTRSCGCSRGEWISEAVKKRYNHGEHYPRLRNIHRNMMSRCYNEKSNRYHRYGARGIKVCEQWHDRRVFCDWARANGYGPRLQIDRINNDGEYAPKNCRFVTPKENANNRSNSKLNRKGLL